MSEEESISKIKEWIRKEIDEHSIDKCDSFWDGYERGYKIALEDCLKMVEEEEEINDD